MNYENTHSFLQVINKINQIFSEIQSIPQLNLNEKLHLFLEEIETLDLDTSFAILFTNVLSNKRISFISKDIELINLKEKFLNHIEKNDVLPSLLNFSELTNLNPNIKISHKSQKDFDYFLITRKKNNQEFTEFDNYFNDKISIQVTNITQSLVNEEKFSLMQAKFNELQVLGNTGLWEIQFSDMSVIWSDQMYHIFEQDKDNFQLNYENAMSIVHPNDRDLVFSTFENAIANKSIYYIEHRILVNNHTKFIIETANVQYDSNGVPIKAIGSATDITAYKEVENKLVAKESLYRSLIESMAEGIVLQDRNDLVIEHNLAAEEILGLNREQLLGKSSHDPNWKAIHSDGSTFKSENHPSVLAMKSGKAVSKVIMGVHKPNKELTWISINSQPIFLENNSEPDLVVTTFNDITEEVISKNILENLAQTFSAVSNIQLFKKINQYVLETFELDIAFVASFQADNQSLDVLSIESANEVIKPFSYPLENSPFQNILEKGLVYIETNLRQRFPSDKILEQYGAESLIAFSLYAEDGRVIGIFAAISKSIIPNLERVAKLLRIFVDRLSNELERLQMKSILQLSESRLKIILDTEPDCVKVLDKDLQLLEMNSAGLEMIQAPSLDAVLNANVLTVIAPEHRVPFKKLHEAVLEGETRELEFEIVGLEGKRIWVSTKAVPFYFNGEVMQLAVTRNISEQKLAYNTISKYFKAIESTKASIIITDSTGIIEYVNPYCLDFTGYTNEEIIGQNPRILQSGVNDKSFYKNVWETILSGKTWDGALYNRKKNGEFYWESAVISPIYNNQNELINFVSIQTNITDRIELEQRLKEEKERAEESNNLKTAFLQNISHEIRTPLNGIIGFASIIANEELEKDELKEFTELIRQSSNRLIEIVHNILDLAKLESNQLSISNKYFSVFKLLDDLYATYLTDAMNKSIDFRIKNLIESEDFEIYTDESILSQILGNFVNNAIKFTKSGYLELGCKMEQNNLVLWVKDTGIGVNKDLQNRIFESFYQVDSSISRGYEGCGLGLAISKRLSELIDAEIIVDSELAMGSTFSLVLENITVAPNSNISLAPEKIKIDKNLAKVLIAEDNLVNFLLIERILKKYNVEIFYTDNGKGAVEIFQNNPDIDLVLMDLKMPIMDGYEATQRIKEQKNNVPVIAQTAYSEKEEKWNVDFSKFDSILMKPFTENDVLKVLNPFIKLNKIK